ncbi:MAG: twin-arginine translocase TatA/TatE family subunit [SAR324 cluster bacterium]|nr:twin-arginine translocase TatA/TatE family subunit [SAR324 cluster bacterium]MBF0353327.1 twin-arginine translocase TatA/TatE family subunit [SAR324 cluster bacterium]
MFGLGMWELLVILSIVVILFGAKRLPMIGEGVGKMISNFKKSTREGTELDQNPETSGMLEQDKKKTS